MSSFSWYFLVITMCFQLVGIGLSIEKLGKTEMKTHKLDTVIIQLIFSILFALAIYLE